MSAWSALRKSTLYAWVPNFLLWEAFIDERVRQAKYGITANAAGTSLGEMKTMTPVCKLGQDFSRKAPLHGIDELAFSVQGDIAHMHSLFFRNGRTLSLFAPLNHIQRSSATQEQFNKVPDRIC